MIVFDTNDKKVKYLEVLDNNSSSASAVFSETTYINHTGQTLYISPIVLAQNIVVFKNGTKLTMGVDNDYTFTSGQSTIYFTTSLIDSDSITLWNQISGSVVAGQTIQYSVMPTASSSFLNKVIQYIGETTTNYEQGLFYICELQGSTYSWNVLQVEQIATANDFGIVKVDNSSIIANSGIISANKATGNYSTTFVGTPATTTSSTNIGANSVAHGWYASAIGCDAVVGDKTNDVRVPGAIQLGRGSNTEAGSMYVGLSTNGSTWNNYKLLRNDGKVPMERLDLTQITGYDASKTQTLKNVNGTLTWIDD